MVKLWLKRNLDTNIVHFLQYKKSIIDKIKSLKMMNAYLKIKKPILPLLFCPYLFLTAQKKSNNKEEGFGCYLPTGEKCNVGSLKNITVGEINKKFEKSGRVWSAYLPDEQVDVNFKSFTMVPLFILTFNNKPLSSDKIKELISKINEDNSSYSYYFGKNIFKEHHWGVKADIERFIKRKVLDQDFLFSTLGFPNEVKESLYDGNPVKSYVYKEIGVRIYFSDGFAIGFDEIN